RCGRHGAGLGRGERQGAAQVRRPHRRRQRGGVLPRRPAPGLRQFRRHGAHLASAALTSFHKEPNMTTWLPRWFALLVLALPFVPVAADAPDDAEIARLVKQLGDEDFDKREAATTRLKEIGEALFDALHQATTSHDPEVRRRAEDLVAVLEKKLSGEQLRFTGHTALVRCVCVSADGKRVLTSSEDKTLRLWDADTGKELRVFAG